MSNSWDDESDDYSGYSDEFDIDESVAEAAPTPRAVDTSTRGAALSNARSAKSPPAPTPAASPHMGAAVDDAVVNASPRAALTARGRGRQESLLNMYASSASGAMSGLDRRESLVQHDSPKMKLTARGRGRQESLLNMIELDQSRQKSSSSSSSLLNLPVWEDVGVKEVDYDDDEEYEDKQKQDGSKTTRATTGELNIPVWGENDIKKEQTTVVGPRFNRDLTHTGNCVNVNKDDENDLNSEYLSASTSAAVATMINNTRRASRHNNVRRSTQEEDDRVLAWLAAQAEPPGSTKGMQYAANMKDSCSQWHINPKLREPAYIPRSASEQAKLRLSVEKRLSELGMGMSLADNSATPGSVEESVLQLMFESLLDNMRYPIQSEDEAEYQSMLVNASEDDRVSLAALRRAHVNDTSASTTPGSRPMYTIPNVKNRPGAESATEACYLSLVRRACLENLDRTHDLAKSNGISVELATRVQKELIGVVTDMFTDPSIVSTIKTATLSRVFKGTPLPQQIFSKNVTTSGTGFVSP